ncbi:hypothetical protein [Methylophaga thalassica]|uniref:hypothetical protein n=1 Tax=Methylophaga aminisulfidivorans TaxID=230105 RepID=UPI003A8EBF5B
MEILNLKVKFKDVSIFLIKNSWLGFALGFGIAFYQGHIRFDNLLLVLTPMVGCVLFVLLFASALSCMTLSRDGIKFKNWRGRDVFCGWDTNLSVDKNVKGNSNIYLITDLNSNKTYKVPKIVFSYAETKEFINSFSPPNHPFRDLGNESS